MADTFVPQETNLRVATDKRVTLLLPGGFVNSGALEVGFLTALDETGFMANVDTIVACSVGSLNGVMAATGRISELRDFWLTVKPEDIFQRRSLFQLGLSHGALVLAGLAEKRELHAKRMQPFWRALRRFFEAREFYADAFNNPTFIATFRKRFNTPEIMGELEASSRELLVMTTDFTNAEEKVFSSRFTSPSDMEEAVIASASIPAFFPPRKINGHIFVDGAEFRPEPLAVAFNTDCDLVLAIRDVTKPIPVEDFPAVNSIIQRIFEIDQYERRMREWAIADEKTRDVTIFLTIRMQWLLFKNEFEKYYKESGAVAPEELTKLAGDLHDAVIRANFSFRYDRVIDVVAIAPIPKAAVHVPFYGGVPDFSAIPSLMEQGYEETLAILKEKGLVKEEGV